MKTLFGPVYGGDREAEGPVNHNWNDVEISGCAAVAAYADPCLGAWALCHTQ